jgi:hypothetical protein
MCDIGRRLTETMRAVPIIDGDYGFHNCKECAVREKRWAWSVTPLLMAISVAALARDIVEDAPARHNMLVVGTETVFLSHLFWRLGASYM